MTETMKNRLHAFCKRGKKEIMGSFPLTKCMELVFHSFCHRPDDGSLKLKLVT
jgi:hypothetical protein